ncbi:MAG: hypothetical protein CME02_03240 [Geminicoccus sp.]|nr:hypothetical protein [Geminicoccus sp.]
MKMLFQAASAAAFCSLALSGITHAQSAEYIDKRLKQIDDNIAKFEMKIDEAGCATAEDADLMVMCERLAGRISAHEARKAMYAEGVPADCSNKKVKRLNRDLAKLAALDADDAEYEEKKAKFERKIAYREAKVERIRETIASLMAEPPTSE